MNQATYYRRWESIPDPIREIAASNVAVQRLCEEYARGNLCTLEETLCQMVLALNTDWAAQRDAYLDLCRCSLLTPAIPAST